MSSLHTLASRVVMASFAGPTVPAWVRRRLDDGLGSICLFGSNVVSAGQLAALTTDLHGRAPDVLVATDEEGGDVTRLHMREGSPHPGNAALGAADDLTLTAAVAGAIGCELAAVGVDLDLAPVVDINSNPANPVIGVRSFGADPTLVARHTVAYVEGLQAAGVAACVKHFPGHGDTAVDSHLALPTVDVPADLLRARELVPFAAAVSAGAIAVMTSHVLVQAVDAERPATLSAAVLSLLRDELGFGGLVVSDALDMKGASGGRGEPAAAVLALAAGCDLLCLGADKDDVLVGSVVDAVVAAVRDGTLADDRLAEAADRVLAAARLVRSWQPRRDAAVTADDGVVGRDAASRALRVTGPLPSVRGAVVLRFCTGSNIAVGAVRWGLPADGAVLAGGEQVDVDERARIADLLSAAANRPMVALVREPQRHAWVAERLAQLATARPDVVVADMGWPGEQTVPGVTTVWTYGASRACALALDTLLTQESPP